MPARITLLASQAVPAARLATGYQRGLSVLVRAVSRRAYGSWTTPGLTKTCDVVSASVAFLLKALSRRPEFVFSKLDSSPVDASVYTSPGTSRHPAQDSRSRWFVIVGLFHPTARRFIARLALPCGRGLVGAVVSARDAGAGPRGHLASKRFAANFASSSRLPAQAALH